MKDSKMNRPVFDDLNDRMIGNASKEPSLSVQTEEDSKDVTKNNPYFDRNKEYTKEEMEKFKKFFS